MKIYFQQPPLSQSYRQKICRPLFSAYQIESGIAHLNTGVAEQKYLIFKGAPLRLRRSNPSFLVKPPLKGKGTRCGAVSKHSVANSSLCQKAVIDRTDVFYVIIQERITHLNTGVAEQNIFNFQRCSASAAPFESLFFLLPPPLKGKGTRCDAVSEHSVANSTSLPPSFQFISPTR